MKDMLMNEYSVSKLFVKNSPTSRINSRADFGYKEEHVWDIEKYLSDEELDRYIEVLSDIVNYMNEKKAQLELI